MGVFIQSSLIEILIFAISVVVIVIINYYHECYKYWTKKGVPTIPPRFPFGNNKFSLPRGFTIGLIVKKFYDEFKQRGHKFGGVYLVTEPNLIIIDPDYIKDVMCTNFEYFVDRGFYFNEKDDPISANIFTVDGTQWRNLRVKLTPTFTSSKMKTMFHSVIECCSNMIGAINNSSEKDIDIKETLKRFTTDVIGTCAFGIDCNSFKHPDAEFRKMGQKIFYFDFWRSLRAFFIANLPKLSLQLGLTSNNKEVQDFFTRITMENYKMRKESQFKRNDFLQILVDMKDATNITLNEVAAQVFLFFMAGFETSSSVMTFALYELAKNSKIQNKLRQEIQQVLEKHDDQITYENLSEMTYLGQVFDEALRKYPPALTLNRRCVKDYNLPNTDIVIEKGTPILFSVLGLHRDPEYYPDPEKFDPERFSEDQKNERHPFVYLPFGNGPRNCIGGRFGVMQSKIGIALVIKNFKLSVSPATKPIELDPDRFLLDTVNKIYLKAKKLK